MVYSKCKICRRVGQKLFLKGERCYTAKCSMIKRPYPPGKKGKRRRSSFSEYSKELREKQRLRNWYNLGDKQLKRYIGEVLKKRGKIEDPVNILIRKLEGRLDSIIFQFGFARSRSQARQLISHGYFYINERKVNIPSHQLKRGDKVRLNPKRTQKKILQNISSNLKKQKLPPWLKLNIEKLEGEVIGEPSIQDISLPIEIPAVFEFYSR